MTELAKPVFLTLDGGLKRHWVHALGKGSDTSLDPIHPLSALPQINGTVWVDLAVPNLPLWSANAWRDVFKAPGIKIIAASSSPNDEEGMLALDAGCAAYCHAFSDALTLQRVQETVLGGSVWVGRSLMNRLLTTTARTAPQKPANPGQWSQGLTPREAQVSVLAANGASNQLIASECDITERTVKAHLSAVFEKLNVTDRLQLALRVHGIL